jgi:MATE family multidrug resistance protein
MDANASASRPGRDSISDLHGAASAEGTFEDPLVPEAAPLNEATPALRNHLLTGPLRPTVFWLALPVLLEQFLNFCVGTCDIWLAGHLPDPSQTTPATTAVGVAAYVGWLASMLFTFVAAGTTALVARHWGAGEHDAANRITNRSLLLAGLAGMGFVTFIWPAAPLVPRALVLDDAATAITIQYLRIDSIGLVFTAISLVAAAALRGSGDTKTPMFVLGAVSLVNLVMSAGFVYGWPPFPALGVTGIVWGTLVARCSGGLLMLAWLASGRGGLRLRPGDFSLFNHDVWRILRIGLPAGADGAILWTGHFVFLRIISELGPVAMAAHMVGIRVEAITYLPAVAWGAAAATMVGQSLGSGDADRARRSGHEAVKQCGLLGIAITLTFTLAADWIFRQMHTDPEVCRVGAQAFPIVGIFQIPLLVGIIYVASLRGAGDTRFPLLMTALSTFCLRLPAAWFLSTQLGWGLLGAWTGMCLDMGVRSVMASTRFVQGKWQRIEV